MGLTAALKGAALPSPWFDALADFSEEAGELQHKVNSDRADALTMARYRR